MTSRTVIWHKIYDATIAAGKDPAEAVRRADGRYWPAGEKMPDEFEIFLLGNTSPFPPPSYMKERTRP